MNRSTAGCARTSAISHSTIIDAQHNHLYGNTVPFPMALFTLNVNGHPHTVDVPPMTRLLDVLRHHLALTGTKEGCGEGECGACSVTLDGLLVNSCLIPIGQANGARICTIEGLAPAGQLHPVQQSFITHGGAQCGICTPGMVMAAATLLAHTPHPDLPQIQEALSGNLCRCTGYQKIFEAVRLTYAEQRDLQNPA